MTPWFIVMIALLPGGKELNTDNISGFRFKSHEACMMSAQSRADALVTVGVHGQFMCMYHDQPTRSMAKYSTGEF